MNVNIALINSRSITFVIDNGDKFYLKRKLTAKIGDRVFAVEKVVNSVYNLEPDTNYILEIFEDEN
ncbi:MAG: glycoside hydrolase family 28 protein, partial [Cetobacterium sp.]